MPEDRLGDLDPGERRRSAAERLAELESGHESAGADGGSREPPPPRRGGSRYAWVVGVAVFVIIVAATLNSLPNEGRGLQGPEQGAVLPDFAAASVDGESEGDANIRQDEGGSDEEGAVPACEVATSDVVNICELRERPVLITFVADGCESALDQVDAVRADFPGVSFVGVISGESREDLADLLEQNEWGFPIALDPDAAVFNLYRLADCPTTVSAEAGGKVVETTNGPLTEEELRAAIETAAGGERAAS